MTRKSPDRTLSEYDRTLKRFEQVNDTATLPDVHLVIRIDAHRISKDWVSYPDEEYPLGDSFVRWLEATAWYLLKEERKFRFVFVHGDEISCYLSPIETKQERKRVRLVSGIASAASTYFLKTSGRGVLFHAVLSELPTADHVLDYFTWQWKVAQRNFTSRYLGILLARQGKVAEEIHQILSSTSIEQRLELLAHEDRTLVKRPSEVRYGSIWWLGEDSLGLPCVIGCRNLALSDSEFIETMVPYITAERFPNHSTTDRSEVTPAQSDAHVYIVEHLDPTRATVTFHAEAHDTVRKSDNEAGPRSVKMKPGKRNEIESGEKEAEPFRIRRKLLPRARR